MAKFTLHHWFVRAPICVSYMHSAHTQQLMWIASFIFTNQIIILIPKLNIPFSFFLSFWLSFSGDFWIYGYICVCAFSFFLLKRLMQSCTLLSWYNYNIFGQFLFNLVFVFVFGFFCIFYRKPNIESMAYVHGRMGTNGQTAQDKCRILRIIVPR